MQDKDHSLSDGIRKKATLAEADVLEIENELGQRYCALGKRICDIAGSSIGEINALVDTLVEAKLRLADLREQVICTGCLSANPIANHYCGICGRSLDDTLEGGNL